ncbi:MAG TPA: phosphatase PAP2 family protein [Patescibacteria group bacterium]|nr:phosphatase PAP2 family protein [Patescibacteria group bacterium]
MGNIVTFFATFFILFLFLGLGVLWVIDGRIKKEQVRHALLSCLIAWTTGFLIKYFFPVPRPFEINGGGVGVLVAPTDGAFPSNHTTLAFAIAVTIFMHDRKVGWLFLASAFLIGVARVLANVHYPVDIFGGAFLGTIVAVIVEKVHLKKILP